MKLGISSYTFGWAVGVAGSPPQRPWTEIDLLDFAAAHGIELLQIGDNLPLHTFSAERLAQLAREAKARNIKVEVGARGLTSKRVKEYVRIARFVDATLIRFVIDDSDFHPRPAEVTTILKQISPLLDGLLLGIENHDRFASVVLRRMIEDTCDERIGICLDTANSLGAGEGIDHVLSELSALTFNVHIKDFWIERLPYLMGFTVTGRPAGSGMLDIAALIKTLSASGRCKTATLELWTPPEPKLEDTIAKEARWAQQSLEYLKPFFT